MTVYTLHRLSLSGDTVTPMEEFPSVERAQVAFQTRARRQASAAYFMNGVPQTVPPTMVPFPGADLTGLMVVWKRRAHEMPPRPTDTPDELWRLSPGGGVAKEVWDAKAHQAQMPRHAAVMPESDPFHGDALELEADFTRGVHGAHGSEWISYRLAGRIELKEVWAGECPCKAAIHADRLTVASAMVAPDAFNLPQDTEVWLVRAGAVALPLAQRAARTVAKGLGLDLAPPIEGASW